MFFYETCAVLSPGAASVWMNRAKKVESKKKEAAPQCWLANGNVENASTVLTNSSLTKKGACIEM